MRKARLIAAVVTLTLLAAAAAIFFVEWRVAKVFEWGHR